jgi:hypothetical protein
MTQGLKLGLFNSRFGMDGEDLNGSGFSSMRLPLLVWISCRIPRACFQTSGSVSYSVREGTGMLMKKLATRLFLFCGILALSVPLSAQQGAPSKKGNSNNAASVAGCSPAVAPQPSVIRVEPAGPIRLEMDKPPSPSIWPSFLGPIISGLITLVGVWIGLTISERNTARTIEGALTSNRATLWQKANENELQGIQEKLDKFYGPFMTRLQADHILAQDIRSRQPEGYRLLPSLFDHKWLANLSEGEQKLVAVICEHAGKLEEMIINAGSVDPVLIPYLSRAAAHFRILRLAYERALGNSSERFKQYVYPRQLDGVLQLEIQRLTARANDLRAKPDAPSGPITSLVIPEALRLPPWVDPDGRVLQN